MHATSYPVVTFSPQLSLASSIFDSAVVRKLHPTHVPNTRNTGGGRGSGTGNSYSGCSSTTLTVYSTSSEERSDSSRFTAFWAQIQAGRTGLV